MTRWHAHTRTSAYGTPASHCAHDADPGGWGGAPAALREAAMDLQPGLWSSQSLYWQAGEQYPDRLHPPQSLRVGAFALRQDAQSRSMAGGRGEGADKVIQWV